MRLVYVAGMHRSGTSAVTRVLNLLGLSLGGPDALMPPARDNPHGFWEVTAVARLNDSVLADLGGSWDEPPVLAKGWDRAPAFGARMRQIADLLEVLESDGAPRHALKDPRMSFTLPLWESVAPAEHVVLPVRDPTAVCQSLLRRNGMPHSRGARLWLRYVLQAIQHSPGVHVIDYATLVSDPLRVADALCEELGLGPPKPDAAQAITTFLQPELDHQEPPPRPGQVLELDLARDVYASIRAGNLTDLHPEGGQLWV